MALHAAFDVAGAFLAAAAAAATAAALRFLAALAAAPVEPVVEAAPLAGFSPLALGDRAGRGLLARGCVLGRHERALACSRLVAALAATAPAATPAAAPAFTFAIGGLSDRDGVDEVLLGRAGGLGFGLGCPLRPLGARRAAGVAAGTALGPLTTLATVLPR
ncbi:MAG: hypothetical protein KIT17_04680, partial [Rubrivivax sp.]|nr:hypothetical protein [Rubrivivax sp.]